MYCVYIYRYIREPRKSRIDAAATLQRVRNFHTVLAYPSCVRAPCLAASGGPCARLCLTCPLREVRPGVLGARCPGRGGGACVCAERHFPKERKKNSSPKRVKGHLSLRVQGGGAPQNTYYILCIQLTYVVDFIGQSLSRLIRASDRQAPSLPRRVKQVGSRVPGIYLLDKRSTNHTCAISSSVRQSLLY